MSKRNALLKLICFSVTAFAAVHASPSQKQQVRYCTQVERHVNSNKEATHVFGTMHKPEEESYGFQEWKEYANEEEWAKARDANGGSGDVALVWLRDGKVVQATFTLGSLSGDWALYAFYCFSPDGTLARLQSTLRTFYGDMLVEREYFYDSKKESFRATLTYRDLITGEPKRPGEQFIDREPPLYRQTKDLPFAALMDRIQFGGSRKPGN